MNTHTCTRYYILINAHQWTSTLYIMHTSNTNLARHSSSEEDRQGKGWVNLLHQLSELFRTFKFVLLQPFLHQLFLSLGKNRPAKLQSFIFVELTTLQQDAKVLKEWRGRSWHRRHLLEPKDCLRCTENAL